MNEASQILELSAFKHVVVPIGVITGLGVARIVLSVAAYIQKHENVRFSFVHAIWTAMLFLLFVGLWWFLWQLRGLEADRWSYFVLIYLLIGPTLIYLPSMLLLPDAPDTGKLDLGGLFDRLSRPVFLCFAAWTLWLSCTELYLLGQPFLTPQRAFQGLVLVAFLIGAVFPSKRMAGAVGVFALFLVALSWATVRSGLA